jgi:Mrp family chromosome partitioning ATPase
LFKRLRVAASDPLEGGDAQNKRRIVMLQPESAIAEQFRSLRARIDALAKTRPLRTLAVTSALPEEGKTMAAISLAAVSAMQLGLRVVLVECDLREPTIAAALGLRLDAGVTELLGEGAPLEQLAERYDRVILDLPPTLGLPDAKIVSGLCDGTIFVVRADATPQADIESALDVLGRERVLGVVMNGADTPTDQYAKYIHG